MATKHPVEEKFIELVENLDRPDIQDLIKDLVADEELSIECMTRILDRHDIDIY